MQIGEVADDADLAQLAAVEANLAASEEPAKKTKAEEAKPADDNGGSPEAETREQDKKNPKPADQQKNRAPTGETERTPQPRRDQAL